MFTVFLQPRVGSPGVHRAIQENSEHFSSSARKFQKFILVCYLCKFIYLLIYFLILRSAYFQKQIHYLFKKIV